MNCNKADEYFMKYMDGCLSEEEAVKLKKHLDGCEKCSDEFAVYNSIVKEFLKAELLEAPDDLEAKVMVEIKKLPAAHAMVNKSINTLLTVAVITFFILLSTGFIIFVNRDIIIEMMVGYPSLAPYVSMLTPVSEFVTNFTGNIWQIVTTGASSIIAVVNSIKYFILGAAVILLVLQVALSKRDKVEE